MTWEAWLLVWLLGSYDIGNLGQRCPSVKIIIQSLLEVMITGDCPCVILLFCCGDGVEQGIDKLACSQFRNFYLIMSRIIYLVIRGACYQDLQYAYCFLILDFRLHQMNV